MAPPRAAAGVFAGILFVVGVLPGPAGAASPPIHRDAGVSDPSPVFGVRPAAPVEGAAVSRHFDWTVAPGQGAAGEVVVSNLSAEPLTVAVYGADLLALPGSGGYAVAQRYQPMRGVGAWIRVAPVITVGEGQQRSVPFQVDVPGSAAPGDYGGAVVVEGRPTPGTGMSVETREALEVLVRVPGARTLSARIDSLRVRRVAGQVILSAVLRNTGSVAFGYRGEVDLQGGPPLEVRIVTRPAAARLLPGQAATLQALWRHPPRHAVVTARARAYVAPTGGPTRRVEGSPVTLSFFPWLLVVLALVALALLVSVSRAARRCHLRERRRRAGAGRAAR